MPRVSSIPVFLLSECLLISCFSPPMIASSQEEGQETGSY